ncbi:hypothetical protein FE374_01470 [Georgenia yuyongxinii]|uniref:HTH luxR-type domain-containing protein n=1 Tax=Georgenia yuyongxinii TaxID=2589797 RepID=A0A5B8C2M6_9MICO|nr:hypothetical protein [Georgenia yuyongxinii]QDC23475.1 hypothetical protein FE374_01470 [Georgenia yuyongxinii]
MDITMFQDDVVSGRLNSAMPTPAIAGRSHPNRLPKAVAEMMARELQNVTSRGSAVRFGSARTTAIRTPMATEVMSGRLAVGDALTEVREVLAGDLVETRAHSVIQRSAFGLGHEPGRSPQRTVESHVRNILDELGFDNRAQIAGWMATSDQ